MSFYVGYSSVNGRGLFNNTLYDLNLAVQGLYNQFYTPYGSVVGMSWFGSRIPDFAFKQMTPANLQLIQDDVKRVIATDPRLVFQDLDIQTSAYSVTVIVMIMFTTNQTPVTLRLNYQNQVAAQDSLNASSNLISPIT